MRKGYHNLLRPEILQLVPTDAKEILDLGCGTGELGKALKIRQECKVYGIELNKDAAFIAEGNLDNVICDNLNRYDPALSDKRYDCIIFADILEHLINPWGALRKFTAVLKEGGTIVVSVPNLAHPRVIGQLQKGLFRYEPAGILDITHLRFFTKTTLCQMMCNLELKVTNVCASPRPENPIQWCMTAVKPALVETAPVVTIIILARNLWEYTLQCIESIQEYTEVPYRILIVDNASSDKTVEALRVRVEVLHIENTANIGFAAGVNVALEIVHTPYFVLLNNDTIVTQGWLSKMIRLIDKEKDLVLLGPMSNNVSGPQRVPEVPYSDIKSMHAFARDWGKLGANRIQEFHRIVFFCALFKTGVLNKVGYLDEIFDLGNFEDDDYCLRIKKAGLKAAYAEGVFIHHHGSTTFKNENIDFMKSIQTNKALFEKKWGLNGLGK